MSKKYIVITTIQGTTESVVKFAEIGNWHVVLVGDTKTPAVTESANLTYLSIDDQRDLGYRYVEHCPFDHYCRKNIGYLYCIKRGAEVIADTDDDNTPYDRWGTETSAYCPKIEVVMAPSVVNIYRLFTEEHVWPRGYPLDAIRCPQEPVIEWRDRVSTPIWQGLVNGEPDVDAIYRLTVGGELHFRQRSPVALDAGVYCPFNSQNTIWFPEAFPYIYLPCHVTFRFTDILRGYVAQRAIWQSGGHLVFTEPTAYQERNIHDLLRDFRDEVPCYLCVRNVVKILTEVELGRDPKQNLLNVYCALEETKIVVPEELTSLEAWLEELP